MTEIDRAYLYTMKEVADYLRISERTVRQMVKDGSIGACKVKHWVRIPGYAIEAYLERTSNAQPPVGNLEH